MEKAISCEVSATTIISNHLADSTPKPPSVVLSLKCQAAMAAIKRVKKEIDEKKHQKFLEEEAKVLIETEKDAEEEYENSVEKVLFLIHPVQLIHAVMLRVYNLPIDILKYAREIVINNHQGFALTGEHENGDPIFRPDKTKFEEVFEILRDGIWVAYKPPADLDDEAFLTLRQAAREAKLPGRWAFRETSKTV